MPAQSMGAVQQSTQGQADLNDPYNTTGGSTVPSSTPKQAKTMQAAAHNPAFAKKMGIPVNVAKDFNDADLKRKSGTLASALRGGKGQLSGGGVT